MNSLLRIIPALLLILAFYGCEKLTRDLGAVGCWPEWETCN
jgi:hypothetical protein